MTKTEFPDFKSFELEDRDDIQRVLWDHQPQTSTHLNSAYLEIFIGDFLIRLFQEIPCTWYGILPCIPEQNDHSSWPRLELMSNPE